jgi:N-methylhydantoinase B
LNNAGIDPVRLAVMRHRFASIAEEVGETLRRAAFSPNIKERRDHSAAVFDARGDMIAHAAAIPVHLGSQPLSVAAAIEALGGRWHPGDAVLLNDPYRGGTHLPDLTLVTPVFVEPKFRQPSFLISTRAHHADVGGMSPGSLPLSREIFHEGLRIPPVRLVRGGVVDEDLLRVILANTRTPAEREGDLRAQIAANARGAARLRELCAGKSALEEAARYAGALLDYSESMMRAFLASLPPGEYAAEELLDDDGAGGPPVRVACTIRLARRASKDAGATVDFTGTAPAVPGPLNANRAIALAAVAYSFRAVAGARAGAESGDPPANAGMLRPIRLVIPPGSLLDPPFPAAVALGNVETSQRLVDVVLRALASAAPDLVPAASQGTMNNLTVGGFDPRRQRAFTYYETIGGGAGGGPAGPGASALQVHMTNTWNTPIEALEHALPLRVTRLAVRQGSGGRGANPGGDGTVREIEALVPCEVTLLTERRQFPPYGLRGGDPGACGRNYLIRRDPHAGTEQVTELPGKVTLRLAPGDRIGVETPGGGGFGLSPSGG